MSTTHAQELVQRLYTDTDFRHKLTNAPTPSAKKRIISDAGFADVTADDLKTLPASRYADASTQGSELSDAELESVAGGDTANWFLAGIALGILI
jgi:predicted ribosomally synthesized peptide with nif11-like leader